ncbi:MAG: hypothetical protein WCR30_03305 [Clostridia bacterium]
MLDKQTERVFSIVSKECEGSTFSVIQNEDIFDMLPKKNPMDIDGLHSVINFLSSLEFLDIKIMDEKVICILVLPKGWLYLEQKKNEKKIKKAQMIKATLPISCLIIIFVLCFLATFLCLLMFGLNNF